jgi:hypothetical protein
LSDWVRTWLTEEATEDIYLSRREWGQERWEAQVEMQMEGARRSRSGDTADGYELRLMSWTSRGIFHTKMIGSRGTER